MKLVFTSLFIIVATLVYLVVTTSEEPTLSTSENFEHNPHNQKSTPDILIDSEQNKLNEKELATDHKTPLNPRSINTVSQRALPDDTRDSNHVIDTVKNSPTDATPADSPSKKATPDNTEPVEQQLPGEEVNFKFKVITSTHHLIEGRADSDIGKILFKSRLMPSNEVKLSINLKQTEIDDISLLAYVDIANFTMELDGGSRILNSDHKSLMKYTVVHLRAKIGPQYEGYDIPEHALMLSQMLAYWSASPEGYVHEQRSITSE